MLQVLYDGLCPVCVTEIRFLKFLQRNQPGSVEFVDISLPGYDEAKYEGVSYQRAMEEMHVIDEKDQVGSPVFPHGIRQTARHKPGTGPSSISSVLFTCLHFLSSVS